MKKFTSVVKIDNPFLKTFLSIVLSVLLFAQSGVGQAISESFESGLPSSYNSTATSYTLGSGSWYITNVQAGTTGANTGTKSAQMSSTTGSQLTTPTFTGGLGTVSFYITSSTTSGAYQVNVSSDGGTTWSAATGSPFTLTTANTKTLRSITVNNSSINRIQIYRTGATLYIDDVVTTSYSPSCTPPTTQPSSFSVNTIAPTATNFAFTRGNGDSVIVVARLTSTTAVAPVSGTKYTANAAFGSGGTTGTNNFVVYKGTAAGASTATGNIGITGLTAASLYTLTAYEFSSTGTCYNTTSPATITFNTFSTAPSGNPASFTASASDQTNISLGFSAASTLTNATGYLIFQRAASSATTFVPTNGTAYTVGTTYGDATLAAKIASTSTTLTTISSLSPNTQYYYTIVPYNIGSKDSTLNYYTTSNLTATATTPALAVPTLTTPTSASIVNTTATLGGTITATGGSTISARGIVWSTTNTNPTLGGAGCTTFVGSGTATGAFTVNVTGLTAGSTIYYCAYATNTTGTGYTTATSITTKGVATKLVFSVAPPTTGIVSTNLTSFTVQAQRADNTVDVEYTGTISLSRAIVSGSATLAGTTSASAVAGVATFSAVQFTGAGTYTLSATSGSLTATPSSANIVITLAPVNLAAWDISGTTMTASSSPVAVANSNVTVTGFTRGSGITTSGTAYPYEWGGTVTNTASTVSAAVTAGIFMSFTIKPKAGYKVSFNSIPAHSMYSSNTGPTDGQWQYSINGGSFTSIADVTYPLKGNNPMTAIDLSSISALQNVQSSQTVTFRIVAYGSAGGTFAFYDITSFTNGSASTAADFSVTGIVEVQTGVIGKATATAFTTTYGTPSTNQNFTLSFYGLTDSVVAKAPTGYEVSKDSSNYSDSVKFLGSLASARLSIRLKATAAAGGSYNTNYIVLSSTGVSNDTITTAASGNIVTAKALTITGLSASNKNFDGNKSVSVTGTAAYSGLVNAESFTPTETVTWAFADSAVGNNKTLTRTGTYAAPSTNYTITQPVLTASIIGVVASAPVITEVIGDDGKLSVVFTAPTFNGGAAITNYQYSTDYGATFTSVSPASTASPIVINGLVNGTTYGVIIRAVNTFGNGTNSNVTEAAPVAPSNPTITTTSSITALTTVYGTASVNRTFTVYGSTLYNNINIVAPGGFVISTSPTSGFSNTLILTPTAQIVPTTTIYIRLDSTTTVGTYSGNIEVSTEGASISYISVPSSTVTPLALTISGISISNKVYDGNNTAQITGTPALNTVKYGDVVSVSGAPTATFASVNVANGISITLNGTYTLNGTGAGNYTVTQPTGFTANITKKELTVTGAVASDKTYDGNTTATVTSAVLNGVVGTDNVTLVSGGVFASANAASGIAVTLSITGTSASNYSLTQPGITATINKANQTITFNALANKAVGDADFAPGATSATSAINPITYSSSNTSVATIVSSNIRIVGAGTTTITASQASSTNYNAANVSQSLSVSGTLPVIGVIQTLYAQNFNGMGTSATATLPTGFAYGTDWTTGATATTNTSYSSATAPTAGGFYNFGSGTSTTTDRALVILNATAYTSPRSIILKITNSTGSPISSLNVAFDYEKYRTGSRQFDWTFFHGATSTANISETAGDQSYAADAVSGSAVNAPTTISKSFKISGLTIPADSVYYIRWTFTGLGGSTNAQAIGIDNVSISANAGASLNLPTVTNITNNSAVLGANITSFGTGTFVSRGTVFKTSTGVTATDNALEEGGTTTGVFTQSRSLSPETRYYFKGYATTSEGTGLSTESSFYTLSNPPISQASGLSANSFSSTQLNLSWSPADFPTGGATAKRYILLRAVDPNVPVFTGTNGSAPTVGANTFIVNSNITGTEANDTGLTTSTTYNYLLIPYTWNGTNAATYNYLTASAPTTTGTTSNIIAPTMSASTVSSITNNSAVLGATITSSGSDVIIQRGTIYSTTSPVSVSSNTLDEGGTTVDAYSHLRTGLLPESKYYFSGYAVNAGDGIALSPEVSFYTLSNPPSSAVTNLTATPTSGTQISLNWTRPNYPSEGATSKNYVIIRSLYPNVPTLVNTNGQAPTADANTTILSSSILSSSTSFDNTGLTASTRYNFSIIPYTWDGLHDSTRNYYATSASVVDATTYLNAPTTQPSSIAYLSGTCNSVTLKWKPVSDATRYILLQSSTASPNANPVSGTVYSVGNTLGNATVAYIGANNIDTSANLSGLIDGTKYYYAVYAFNGSTSSDVSYNTASPRTISFTTNNPSAPVTTAATTITLNGLTANWNAVSCAANGYKLDVSNYPEFYNPAFGANTIATEGFENSLSLFTSTGGANTFSTTAAVGTYAYSVSNGTNVLTSNSINTNSFVGNQLSFRLSAIGALVTSDKITIAVSTDDGANWFNTLSITGYGGSTNNAWTFNDASNTTATGIYDGDTIATSLPANGFKYGTVVINNLPSSSTLKIRITTITTSSVKSWALDDFKLTGRTASYVAPYENYSVAGLSQQLTGLTNSTSYYYRVRAAGTNFSSGNSNTTSATTLSGYPTISLPTATSITNTSAVIGATVDNTGAAASISARGTVYKTTTGVTATDNALAEGGTSTGLFTHERSSLSAQTRYYFKGFATNIYGTGFSTESSFITLSNPPLSASPSLTATATSGSEVNLSWTAASFPSSGATANGYVVLFGSPADQLTLSNSNGQAPIAGDYTSIGAFVSGTSTTVLNLNPVTEYNFVVIPFTWNGIDTATINYYTEGPASATVVTYSNITALPATNLNFTNVTCSGMKVSWTNGSGADGVLVLRTTGATLPSATPVIGTTYTVGSTLGNATVAYVGNDSSITYSGLNDNTRLNFKIYSYNGSDNSIAYLTSTTLNGNQTTNALLVPVANNATTIDTSSFSVNWNTIDCASNYNVYVYTNSSSSLITAWTFPVSGTNSYSDTALSNSNNIGNNGLSVVPSTTLTSISGATTQAQSTNNWDLGNKYWQAIVNVTGYTNIKLSSAQSSSNTGPAHFRLQYKIRANGTWTNVSNDTIKVANNYTSGVQTNVSLPSACDNIDSLYVRWINISSVAVTGGTVQSTGTSRIDNIYFRGNLVQYATGYNGVSTSSTTLNVSGLTPNTQYYYHVTATGTSGTVTSISNVVPVKTLFPCRIIATATNNGPICQAATLQLTGNSTKGYGVINYAWTGPNAFTSALKSPSITNATTAATGVYTLTATDSAGCISVVTTSVIVNAKTSSSSSIESCNSYLWNGITYTTSGVKSFTTTNAAGCDSVATLNLTINNSRTSNQTVTICNSYNWNGTTYTTSGVYTYNTTTVAGCDSTAILNLNLGKSTTAEIKIARCNSYLWNGSTYTTTGMYTFNTTNAAGCDSVATLNLTIKLPTASSTTESACSSFLWNGSNYTTSGVYTYVTPNAVGCDSVVTLNLTIRNSSSSTATESACNSYLWNGTTYTTSGVYTFNGTNAAGCDSTATLNLTIKLPTASSTTESACSSFLWNGTTYTASGVYTFNGTNAVNCDSTATLNLTIKQPTSSSSTESACNSYLWNGTTYTTSGVYTFNGTNAAGCDSVATLNLTIKQPTSSSSTESACSSFLWNGTNYTTSGVYTFNGTNAAGCDSVATLNLTIKLPTASTATESACSSFLWNGTTYTASGVYTFNGTNAAGCDSVATLNLTIKLPTESSTTESACSSFLWNGTTYTASGIYTFNTTNAAGCDSVATLNLTVNTCTTTLNVTAFLEGFYTGNGTMRANLYDVGISTDPTATDSVEVNLWSASNLSSATPNYSVKAVLHTNGTLTAVFPGATLNNSYYVALKHRNSIETWSAEPVTIASTSSYDFSTSMSSAYSDGFNDPMKSVSGGKYALYAGDVNQDGSVDLFDAQIVENGATGLFFGYDASDCNGDGLIDLFDLQLIENNGTILIFAARPY